MVKRVREYVDLIHNWLYENGIEKVVLSDEDRIKVNKILQKMFLKTTVLSYKTDIDVYEALGDSLQDKEHIIKEILEELDELKEE